MSKKEPKKADDNFFANNVLSCEEWANAKLPKSVQK